MKHFILTLAIAVVAILLVSPVESQIVDLTGGTRVTAPADPVVNAEPSNYDRTLAEVKQAIQENTEIGPFRKRMLLRKLNRPAVAIRVTDFVTNEALDDGTINFSTPDVYAATGQPYAIDIDALIELIERLLPLILQLLSLFGLTLCWRRIDSNSFLEWFEL